MLNKREAAIAALSCFILAIDNGGLHKQTQPPQTAIEQVQQAAQTNAAQAKWAIDPIDSKKGMSYEKEKENWKLNYILELIVFFSGVA